VLRGLDVALVLLAGWLAYALRFGDQLLPGHYMTALLLAAALTAAIFPLLAAAGGSRGAGLAAALREVTVGWLLVGSVLLALAYVTKSGAEYSRIWVLIWFAFGWGLLLASRLVRLSGFGLRARPVAVVGNGGFGIAVARHLQAAPWSGLRVKAVFGEPPAAVADALTGCPGLHADATVDAVLDYVERERIDQVWLALPLCDPARLRALADALRQTCVDLRLVPEVPGLRLSQRRVSEIAGLSVLELSFSPLRAGHEWFKGVADRVLASLLLLLASPLMLLIALAIKADSPGPVLFRQRRHGLGGGEIEIYKFRTMRVRPRGGDEAVQATPNDPRVTPVGNWLRRSSLDELPQLVNVLQGRMSLVGPRPHPLWLNEQHKRRIDAYAQRHRVKPGITGWAQVHGFRGETDTLEKMRKRIEYDLYYIENWSLLMDLKIMLMTVVNGFMNRNAY
jgi:putative colanic acid biosysnthesis UDP-glucose lipid carrier transferase